MLILIVYLRIDEQITNSADVFCGFIDFFLKSNFTVNNLFLQNFFYIFIVLLKSVNVSSLIPLEKLGILRK